MSWNIKEEVMAAYLEVCREAAENLEVFGRFKQMDAYTAILEHTSHRIATSYLELIKLHNPSLLDYKKFWNNDRIGGALKQHFPHNDGFIIASPTTIQYIGVLSNLIDLYGNLDGMKIIEIGAGYGGQAKIIQDMFKVASYDIVDLKEPGMLQKRYLNEFDYICNIISVMPRPPWQWDLVISNYALTELSQELQIEYLNKFLLHSKHGYLTCNADLQMLPKIKERFGMNAVSVLPDIETERENNFIVVW